MIAQKVRQIIFTDSDFAGIAGSATREVVSEALATHVQNGVPPSLGASVATEVLEDCGTGHHQDESYFEVVGDEVGAQIRLASGEVQVASSLARQARDNCEKLGGHMEGLHQEISLLVTQASAKETERRAFAASVETRHAEHESQQQGLQAQLQELTLRVQELEAGAAREHGGTVEASGSPTQAPEQAPEQTSRPLHAVEEARRAAEDAMRVDAQKMVASLVATVESMAARLQDLERKEATAQVGALQDAASLALRSTDDTLGALRQAQGLHDVAGTGGTSEGNLPRPPPQEEGLSEATLAPHSFPQQKPVPVALTEENLRGRAARSSYPCRPEAFRSLASTPTQDVSTAPTTHGSAQQLSRTTAQSKATLPAADQASAAATPAADRPASRVHADFEEKLAAQVLKIGPNHRAMLGYSEVVLMDMANCVVRHVVGVFDCLLDRMLMEKKKDVLMSMVSELMTEEVATTIMRGQELLREREFGHMRQELAQMRAELRQTESWWDDRFQVVDELRSVQDHHRAQLGEMNNELSSRMSRIEEGGYVHRNDFDERLALIDQGTTQLHAHVQRLDSYNDQQDKVFGAFQVLCADTFATKTAHDELGAALAADAASRHEELTSNHEKLQRCKADFSEVQSVHKAHADMLDALSSKAAGHASDIEAARGLVQKLQLDVGARFASKEDVQQKLSEQAEACDGVEQRMGQALFNLREIKASRHDVEQAQADMMGSLAALRASHDSRAAQVDKMAAGFSSLELVCNKIVAARDEAVGTLVTKLDANSAAAGKDRELVVQLRRELEEERGYLRRLVQQQQDYREDLGVAVGDLRMLKQQSSEDREAHDKLAAVLEDFDTRWSQQLDEVRGSLAQQLQHNRQLETFNSGLRDELRAHIAMQKNENERLAQHSTLRYMEQLDKALALTKAVDKVAAGHTELSEAVKGIKLPPVEAGKGASCAVREE